MTKARILLPAALLSALAVLLILRACDNGPAAGSVPRVAADPGAGADADASRRKRDETRARAELADRYATAMRAAVSTLHRYLAVLPGEDRAAADAFWVAGKPAPDADEADLRALHGTPTQFRTRNRTPEALDRAPLPEAVRIPVELRLALEGQPVRRYEGWYELRRSAGGDDWRISGASIDAVAPRQ